MSEMARQAFDGPKKFEDCALLDVLKARADKGDHISAGARSLAIMLNEDRAKLQREVAELREALARWMIQHGFATGHGDAHADLLSALSDGLAELRDSVRVIEMETRDGGQWTLRDVNEYARSALGSEPHAQGTSRP